MDDRGLLLYDRIWREVARDAGRRSCLRADVEEAAEARRIKGVAPIPEGAMAIVGVDRVEA